MRSHTLGTIRAAVVGPKNTETFWALSVTCLAKGIPLCWATSPSSQVAWGAWFRSTGKRGEENSSPVRNISVCLARPGAWRSKGLDTYQTDCTETGKELVYGLR